MLDIIKTDTSRPNETRIISLHPQQWPNLTNETGFVAGFEPVYMQNHETGRAQQIPSEIGRVVRRMDSGAALGIVGNRYGIAQNPELFDMVKTAADDILPANAKQGVRLVERSSRGGAFTRFELVFPELGQTIKQLSGRSTELFFRVGVSNSFNGGGSILVRAGAYDQVCENGLTIGQFERKTARHTTGFSPALFGDFIKRELVEYHERARRFNDWARREISKDTAEQTLTAAGLSERRIAALMAQFDIETQSRGATVWALFSALTFYSSHNSERFGVRNSGQTDNVAETLEKRENEVTKIVSSPAWLRLAA